MLLFISSSYFILNNTEIFFIIFFRNLRELKVKCRKSVFLMLSIITNKIRLFYNNIIISKDYKIIKNL